MISTLLQAELGGNWMLALALLLTMLPRDDKLIWGVSVSFSGFPDSSVDKESAWNAGDPGSIPGSGKSAGEETDYPLQYSWASLVAQLVNCRTWLHNSRISFSKLNFDKWCQNCTVPIYRFMGLNLFILVTLQGMQDLSSPNRDGTHTRCRGNIVLTTGTPVKFWFSRF